MSEREIIDEHGRPVKRDGGVLRHGDRVHVGTTMMDAAPGSVTRAVIEDTLRSLGCQLDRDHGIVPVDDRAKLYSHLNALTNERTAPQAEADLRGMVTKYHYAAQDMTQPAAWRGAMSAIGDHIAGTLDGAMALSNARRSA